MKLTRMFLSLVALAVLTGSALAETLSWQIIGSGNFKVELYGVGDPYPSRQYFTGRITGEWNAAFFNLSHRNYFVRVTNLNNGQAKQTFAFWIADRDRAWVGMDWGTNFLIYASRFIG